MFVRINAVKHIPKTILLKLNETIARIKAAVNPDPENAASRFATVRLFCFLNKTNEIPRKEVVTNQYRINAIILFDQTIQHPFRILGISFLETLHRLSVQRPFLARIIPNRFDRNAAKAEINQMPSDLFWVRIYPR